MSPPDASELGTRTQQMSESSPKAVFLSYARGDAEAARRIAEALRGFGVEVWFDTNELRGGDAWDQKIRRQIRECALFIPVISTGTQARHEGYFRLEWKLAVERTHLMVAGAAFLVPVVIDDTPETPGMVPDEFLRVQWTRLPGGTPSPQFVAHVQSLLEDPRPHPTAARPADRPPLQVPGKAARSGFPAWVSVLLGIAVLALGAVVLFRPAARNEGPASAPAPAAAPKAAEPGAPSINDKSLAVLPFANMSEEKDSAFFTDGIQEDILTNLALISELHVVSRTSVMQYRNTTKSIKQIGQELGVAYVLEGSVRREGNRVRVTGQLINARTDDHVWAKAYDRDLTDIFAIQGELATEIAGALKAAITPQQKTIIAGRGTTSVEAYSNYLKARELELWSGRTRVTLPEVDRLLQSAVQLDPKFWEAWVEIARVDLSVYRSVSMGADRNRLLAGQAALAQALRLAPEDPKVLRVQALEASALDDGAKARAYLERALSLYPGNAEILIALSSLAGSERNWAETMSYVQRALALDPRNPEVLWAAYDALITLRQWDQALGKARLLQELQPDSFGAAWAGALVPFLAHGSAKEVEDLIARLTPEQQRDPQVVAAEQDWYYHFKGDARAYLDICDRQGPDLNFDKNDSALQYAEALIVAGQRVRALALVKPLRDQLVAESAKDPGSYTKLSSLAYAQAILGEHDASMATIGRVLGMLKPGDSLRKQFFLTTNMSIVCGWIGEKDKAVDLVLPYTGRPVSRYFNVMSLRNDIDLDPMRGFPRWEALLADPKNNEPLSY
jgi:TolB-like protein